MKTAFKLTIFFLAVMTIITACDTKDYYYANLGHTYGEITNVTDDSYTIQSDLNNTLVAINSIKPSFDLTNGTRVYAQIGIEGYNDNEKLVSVYNIVKILTKKPIYFSQLTEQEQEEVGDDPIDIVEAWFSCGKYLNIVFVTLRSDGDTPHFINLKVDEDNSTAEKVYVELRHNDYDEPRLTRAYGIVSFDITELVPAGSNEIEVELCWKDYGGREMGTKGKFSITTQSDQTIQKSSETNAVQSLSYEIIDK